jgi:hypothetical protein
MIIKCNKIKFWDEIIVIQKEIIAIFFLSLFIICSADTTSDKYMVDYNQKWQVSISFGTQMSGIKNEDFVKSNYTPLFNLSAGYWFTPFLALQLGHKGFYFNLISDNVKHYYNYYFSEVMFNVNKLLINKDTSSKWNFNIHFGSGYFYNYDYKRPNICANLSISCNYHISGKFIANILISSVMGWDIYQGNEDILPGLSLGCSYFLK